MSQPTTLADCYSAHGVVRADGVARDEIERALAKVVQAGRDAWPDVALPPAEFVRHLAGHQAGDDSTLAWLGALHAADLYLACACAAGLPEALAAFERSFMSLVASFVARGSDSSPSFTDDVRQRLRERLFVAAAGAVPKIARYSGRGSLANWLRVTTTRLMVDLRRERGTPLWSASRLDEVAAAGDDVEVRYLKDRYKSDFEAVFQASIARLSNEERNILRLHFVSGLTLDELAAFFRVHRATIARKVAAARETIFDEARRLLNERLRVSADEFDSLFRFVRSQLDVSVSRLLDRAE